MDHAITLTAKTLLIISSSAPVPQLRQELTQMFREEIADIERRIAAERNSPDA
jgi:hypothetical protein